MGKRLEEMLYIEMQSRKLNQAALCNGLCSTSALSRYLRGERRMDRLLLTALMQRMGRAPDKFTTVLAEEEYDYFSWKQSVCQALIAGKWKQLEQLLVANESGTWKCSVPIQEQFSLIMEAVVQEKLYGCRRKSLELAGEAVKKTLPDFFGNTLSGLLLSVQEINAVLLWQSLQSDRKKAEEILEFLLEYIVTHNIEQQQIERLYPQIAAPYLRLLYEKGKFLECMIVSEKALKMIISTGYFAGLEQILEVHVKAGERLGMAEAVARRRVQLMAWRELNVEIGLAGQMENVSVNMLDVWQEIELVNEIISLGRCARRMTQEQLSREICAPETLSRIEMGKRLPTRKNYGEIMRRLSLKEDYYYSKMETDDFSLLEVKWKLEKQVMNKQWQEAEKELVELRGRIDLSNKVNLQFMEEKEYVIDNCMGRVEEQNRIPRLIGILKHTIDILPDSFDMDTWKTVMETFPLKQEEITIMLHIADALSAQGQMMQGVELLESIMDFYRRSHIRLEFHYRTVLLVLARLSAWCSKCCAYEKSLSHSKEGIALLVACGNSKMLGLFVNNLANALEHLEYKEESLKYYRLAFYCAELLEQNSALVSKKSYEKLKGVNVDWY